MQEWSNSHLQVARRLGLVLTLMLMPSLTLMRVLVFLLMCNWTDLSLQIGVA